MTDVSNVMSDERRVFVSAHCEVCRTSLASLADPELLEESVAAVRSVGTLISPTSSLNDTVRRLYEEARLYAALRVFVGGNASNTDPPHWLTPSSDVPPHFPHVISQASVALPPGE